MADYRLLVPKIKRWEGGWANDPDDTGGCTLSGITIGTYRIYFGADKTCKDLYHMTARQWDYIFKTEFWDRCKADEIDNQSIAELLVDFAYMSGSKTAIKAIQGMVGTSQDGIMGPLTLRAINSSNQFLLFYKLWTYRHNFFYRVVENRPVTKKYLQGWVRRLVSYTYE